MSFSIKVDSDPLSSYKSFNCTKNIKAYENFEKLQALNIPLEFQYIHEEDDKIFAKNWSPILTFVKGEYQVRPMRYGLVPRESLDYRLKENLTVSLKQLEEEKKWERSLSGLRGIINIHSYFLMKKTNVMFDMQEYKRVDSHSFFAPVIYDNWFSEDKSMIIQSFSLIVDNDSELPLELDFANASAWLNGNGDPQDLSAANLEKVH